MVKRSMGDPGVGGGGANKKEATMGRDDERGEQGYACVCTTF